MKRFTCFLFTLLMLVGFTAASHATTYSFSPSPADLYDLDHSWAYTWGLNFQLPENETIVGASLFFNDIRNWDDSSNVLYLHLLDDAVPGVIPYFDAQIGTDFFGNSNGILLSKWINLPSTAQDITYSFDAAELNFLAGYLLDGNVGFGFDPDCHFYNNGVSFTIETDAAPVPEPATLVLLGTGLMGIAGLGRKKLQRR